MATCDLDELRGLFLFEGLTDTQLTALCANARIDTFPPGVLCREGDPAEFFYVLLDGEIGLVGVSGEFFCNHAIRLRERAGLPHLLFIGYCNGHHLYFPPIEGAAEGGYGADAPVSPVALGAGEVMMNRALTNLLRFRGKFPADAPEAR